jgi:hypothetical protein
MHSNKECSNDTPGDHTLPTSQHIGEDPADGSEPPPEAKADRNGFAVTEMTSTIPNRPMGCQTTLHRPSAVLACNETTAVSTPTAESMEKIISNRQNKKDGKQEYLVQCGRGLHELDRTGSWTYS